MDFIFIKSSKAGKEDYGSIYARVRTGKANMKVVTGFTIKQLEWEKYRSLQYTSSALMSSIGIKYGQFAQVLAGKGGILVRCFLDVAFCLLVGAGYVALALEFLSGFRFFHLLGLLCGLFLYEKSFHKTVAFFGKMVYNAHVKVIQKQKDRALWKQRNNPSPRKKPRGSQ